MILLKEIRYQDFVQGWGTFLYRNHWLTSKINQTHLRKSNVIQVTCEGLESHQQVPFEFTLWRIAGDEGGHTEEDMG